MFGAKAATDKLAQGVYQKTGLQLHGDRFAGHFMGLPAWSKTEMVASAWSMAGVGNAGLLGGLGALAGGNMGGMLHASTGGDFMMKHLYVVELHGNQLPGASLRESTSILTHKGIQQRGAIGPRCSSGVAWIDQKYEVCSNHPQFIQYCCQSHELQQAMNGWPFLNLSWEADKVVLELMDTTRRLHDRFGTAAMQNGDMVHRGIWVAACAARATFAR